MCNNCLFVLQKLDVSTQKIFLLWPRSQSHMDLSPHKLQSNPLRVLDICSEMQAKPDPVKYMWHFWPRLTDTRYRRGVAEFDVSFLNYYYVSIHKMIGAREILETSLEYLSWISLVGTVKPSEKIKRRYWCFLPEAKNWVSLVCLALYGGNLYNFGLPVEKSRKKFQNPSIK